MKILNGDLNIEIDFWSMKLNFKLGKAPYQEMSHGGSAICSIHSPNLTSLRKINTVTAVIVHASSAETHLRVITLDLYSSDIQSHGKQLNVHLTKASRAGRFYHIFRLHSSVFLLNWNCYPYCHFQLKKRKLRGLYPVSKLYWPNSLSAQSVPTFCR
jgi:hypothetical protein